MEESEKQSEKSLDEQKIALVIPIVKGLPKATLSYFTRENLSVGAFVKIPIRNGVALGIVTSISSARTNKTNIKRASFVLKKLSSGISGAFGLPSYFIRATEKTSIYYATTVGNILSALIPKILLENPQLINSAHDRPSNESRKETLLIQLNNDERFQEYKSSIRESFARGKSVLFCVPTHEEALSAFDYFSPGIATFTYLVSNKGTKALKETLKKAHESEHPVLFITTPSFISFNRADLETIILERENSRVYKTFSKPFINIKVFLEYLAKESNKTLILGDSVLSIETLWKEKQGQYAELSPLKWRTSRDSRSILVDMKKPTKPDEKGNAKFEIFSPEIKKMIEQAVLEKRKVFLFGARKGLSPSTVCSDCGSVLSCENCGSPLVLHSEKNSVRVYICHACGARRNAETRCDHCQSWNLTPLGVGTDRIREEVEKLFPSSMIYILDKEHASTAVRASKIAKSFAGEKGGIMIGTELAFFYLKKIPYVGLVSIDSLFSIPDFGINERIFYLITRLFEISEVQTIIQTRNIGKQIIEYAESGSILDFYRSEIEEREALHYPPFSIFIKVSTFGTPREIEKKTAYLNNLFLEHGPDFMNGREVKTGKNSLSMVLRLPRKEWPSQNIVDKLLLLTPDFLIKVDPISII